MATSSEVLSVPVVDPKTGSVTVMRTTTIIYSADEYVALQTQLQNQISIQALQLANLNSSVASMQAAITAIQANAAALHA